MIAGAHCVLNEKRRPHPLSSRRELFPLSVPERGAADGDGGLERGIAGGSTAMVAETATVNRAARPATADDIVRWRNNVALWAHDNVWIQKPDGSVGPIELFPEQREFLERISMREQHPDGLGRPTYKTVVASWPKRNAKSLSAAIVAAHATSCFTRRTSGIVANSQDQARSVTFDYVADIFDFSPNLQGMAYYGDLRLSGAMSKRPQVTTITVPELGNECRAMVPNVRTIQGRGINGVAVIEELQAAFSEEAYALLAAQTEAESAQIYIASQAGHRSGALWRLYNAAGNQGGDSERIWFEYWGDEDELLANKAPWVTEEFIESELVNMTPWEADKYVRNLWGGGARNYLSPAQIDELFRIRYPLAAFRHDPNDRKATPGELRTLTRDEFEELRDAMGWRAWAVAIGLDRAKPHANQEKTNVSAMLKAHASAEMMEKHDLLPGTHTWEIASIDCPNGTRGEIDEAVEAIEETVGRRIEDRRYEEYQCADLAEDHGADLVSASAPRQVKLFNGLHSRISEGRVHCSPESIALRAELDEFEVDDTGRWTKYEHSSGMTDDRIYSHAYAEEMAQEAIVLVSRTAEKARWM